MNKYELMRRIDSLNLRKAKEEVLKTIRSDNARNKLAKEYAKSLVFLGLM